MGDQTELTNQDKIKNLLKSCYALTRKELTEEIYGSGSDTSLIRPALVKLAESKEIIYNKDISTLFSWPSSMTSERAVSLIQDFMQKITNDEHCRYLSWEHCYKVFSKYRKTEDLEGLKNNDPEKYQGIIDQLALNLAFYLASWGMYRGSAFLLQTDYKVHIPIVEIIIEKRYDSLLGVDADTLINTKNPKCLSLVMELSGRIKDKYAEIVAPRDGKAANATDTLVTKILLGTLGCTPAFDRYYISSVKRHHISSGRFYELSLRSVANFYCIHSEVFENLRKELSKRGVDYPPMKLMDMCFWQDGFSEDLKNRNSTKQPE